MLITINIYEEQKMIDITIVIHSKKNSENIFVRKKNEMNEIYMWESGLIGGKCYQTHTDTHGHKHQQTNRYLLTMMADG